MHKIEITSSLQFSALHMKFVMEEAEIEARTFDFNHETTKTFMANSQLSINSMHTATLSLDFSRYIPQL
jgi:hypothetical protein